MLIPLPAGRPKLESREFLKMFQRADPDSKFGTADCQFEIGAKFEYDHWH